MIAADHDARFADAMFRHSVAPRVTWAEQLAARGVFPRWLAVDLRVTGAAAMRSAIMEWGPEGMRLRDCLADHPLPTSTAAADDCWRLCERSSGAHVLAPWAQWLMRSAAIHTEWIIRK